MCAEDTIDKSRLYVLVHWPESQDLMDYDWFENEAILGESSSYFIPYERYTSIVIPDNNVVDDADTF